jgi:hypothetical protein
MAVLRILELELFGPRLIKDSDDDKENLPKFGALLLDLNSELTGRRKNKCDRPISRRE